MEYINNIEIYIKIFVGFIGAIAAFGKLREIFASNKRKQELKLDLEILEKLKNMDNFETVEIEEKIKNNLKNSFEKNSDNLTNFFTGIAVFIEFGFWTVDIINNSDRFNGWIILTLFCSLIGLTLIFDNKNKETSENIFYQIGFYNKENFKFSLILILFTGILTPLLVWKMNEFSFWQFLAGLFFFIGVFSLIKNIKHVK